MLCPDIINNRVYETHNTSIAYGDCFIEDSPLITAAVAEIRTPFGFYNQQPSYLLTAESQGTYEISALHRSKQEDPLTQNDILESKEEQVQELIFQIRQSPLIRCHEKLAHRLYTLFNIAKEEDYASIGIAIDSLKSLHHFFKLNNNLKCPMISLTPNEEIYISWREQRKLLFSMHFFADKSVSFVMFKQNDKHPERKIRISGTATIDTVKEIVASTGVWDWISNER